MPEFQRLSAKQAKQRNWRIGDGQPLEVFLSPYPNGKQVRLVWLEDTWSRKHPWVAVWSGTGEKLGMLKIDVQEYSQHGYFAFRSARYTALVPMYVYN